MKLIPKLENWDLEKKRVFLRVDLNVPIQNGKILDDFRIRSILPTINLIQDKGGKIILATHIGRPKEYESSLSTKILAKWFDDFGYKIDFEPDLSKAEKKSFEDYNKILLLENLRFFKGEQANLLDFAEQLKKLADYYINDSFGTMHEKSASIVLLPELLDKNKISIGPLVEKELKALDKLISDPKHPFIVILGGAKVYEKLSMLDSLVDKVDSIALCPAIVFTFLKSQSKEVGKSFVELKLLDFAGKVYDKAQSSGVEFVFPVDYLVSEDSFEGKLHLTKSEKINKNEFGISIGPETAKLFSEKIKLSKTIFFNGLPGFNERKETLEFVNNIFKAMSDSKAYTVIAGGDSVAAACKLGFEDKIDHLCTGGGSALAYISGKKMFGLEVFQN